MKMKDSVMNRLCAENAELKQQRDALLIDLAASLGREDELKQQRDELLALLSEIKPLLERELQVEFDAANERAIKWALPKIDAAIAKVKGEQK